ncbi:30S ribosomal protein S6 [Acidiluteibacter ferrifornacis]|uniref:Small ribosomal subunit protein bS6 n=1 Tax=Acidiluteibacter ferrifornacis TaxID=2692424 RepID=A0A6N9NJG1_9FLAO|nr:30S ribosomal protein S6 [Acidiluteibacter ferrifornacis]NBG66002.1 30S ribosomal protein S6 [Acidiluteibacter ferrifornacis]
MSNHYEAVFIMTPVLSLEQTKETADKFKAIITENGGAIVNDENWGLKKLAYPIQKKSTGFYQMYQFESSNGELIEKIETAFRRDERIMRFLTIKLDKYGVEYAARRIEKNKALGTKK